MRIGILCGSTHDNSLNKRLAQQYVAVLIKKNIAVEPLNFVEIDQKAQPSNNQNQLNLEIKSTNQSFVLPMYSALLDTPKDVPKEVLAMKKRASMCQAFIGISPEYNGYFTPLFKNLIDWLSRDMTAVEGHPSPFTSARCAVGSASPGGRGGIRCIQALQALFTNVGGIVAPFAVSVSNATVDIIDTDPQIITSINKQIEQIIEI